MSSRTCLTGRVVVPGQAGYDEARTNFNLRIEAFPRVIVFCQTVYDVVNAVRWARENDVPIRVRSGRHSYEGFSLGDGIVIDVVDLDTVTVDEENLLAVVGAGTALLPLYEALAERRLALPGGSCPTVGIAGLTLAGGYGLLARTLGLACDSLLRVEMVSATGAIVSATETQNPDLLWASRGGGGGSFGVATSFTFRAHPVGRVAVYRIEWPWRELPRVLDAWQRWAPFTDDRLTSVLKLLPASADRVASTGLFVGRRAELSAALAPLRATGHPRRVEIDEVPSIEAMRRYAGVSPGRREWRAHWHAEGSIRFKNTSAYAQRPLGRAGIDTLSTWLARAPNAEALVQLDAYGGAISRVPASATAFPHRAGTLYNLQYQSYWTKPEEEAENVAWVEGLRAAMRPHLSGGAYSGYADRAIRGWQRAYYGSNFDRLVRVKTKYDPEDVFHHPQSIPTARAGEENR